MNNLNLFNDLSKGWWYFNIDNIISECIDFLISHILNMLYQATSFSEHLFFSSPSGFFTCQLHRYSFSTYQLHYYSSTSTLPIVLDFFSFEPWIFWQLPFCFQVSRYFLSFFGCCECWLPRISLSLHYERHWCLLHEIHNQIELKKRNTGIV